MPQNPSITRIAIGVFLGGVAVLAAYELVPRLMREQATKAYENSKLAVALNEIEEIQKLSETYMTFKNTCPSSMQDIKSAGLTVRAKPDPWGSEYVITCPGTHGADVDVSSWGPDKTPNTSDDLDSWTKSQ